MDGGQPVASGGSSSVVAVLESFVEDCPELALTGLCALDSTELRDFIEVTGAGTHEVDAIADRMGEVVDRASRAVRAMDADDQLGEIQITFGDAYGVVRHVADGTTFHFAVVDRQASLGVVLVLMRQYADQLAEAVRARRDG